MKLILLIIALLLIISFASSYENNSQLKAYDSDSLRKYSYRIVGDFSSEGTMGTVFFYKKGTNLYLITANHVLCGCAYINNVLIKDSVYPVIFTSMRRESDSSTFFFLLKTQRIRDTCECSDLFGRLDIIVVPVPDDEAKRIWDKVYSIEGFEVSDIVNGGMIEIVGYPGDSNFLNGRRNIRPLSGILSWSKEQYETKFADPVNYVFQSRNYSIPNDTLLKGYSGSPVFFMDNNSDHWKIAGVFSGTINENETKSRYMRIPKIKYPIEEILNRTD